MILSKCVQGGVFCMAVSVLIVASDKASSVAYAGFFNKKEFTVLTAHSGRQAIAQAKSHHLDVIVVDLTSTRLNCKSISRKLASSTYAPIVLITAANAKVDGTINAAGFLAKPIAGRKLVTRVKSAIDSKPPRVLTVGKLSLDLERHKLTRGSRTFSLTPKEFTLLRILMNHAGQVVSRRALMKEVWQTDYLGDTRTLDVHIRWVRKKVEDNPEKPQRLVTLRGQGYTIQDEK
jgi:two-component system, OmpR family, response regulator RegX3